MRKLAATGLTLHLGEHPSGVISQAPISDADLLADEEMPHREPVTTQQRNPMQHAAI